MLENLKAVAKKNETHLLEASNGTYIMEFEAVGTVSPLLLSADSGHTWCPEAMCSKIGKRWSGNISLQGLELETEIRGMYHDLKLGNPDKMIATAQDLQLAYNGKLFS